MKLFDLNSKPSRYHFVLLFTALWLIAFNNFAVAHKLDLPSVGTITKNQDGVTIKVTDQNLLNVIATIEAESGIKISLAGHLNQDKITADIHQPDWSSAIKRLLSNYSTIEIGSDPLFKVRIMDRTGEMEILDQGQPTITNNSNGTQTKDGFVYRPVKRIQKKIWANESIPFTREQLEMVVGNDYHAPLPKEMLNEPLFRSLLSKYGIETEKDLGHFPKARQVRAEAGKMLRVLKKRESLN